MLNPSGSSDNGLETGATTRKPGRPTPVVDDSLRAGAKLAQARQMLGLTLDEIAERTKVRRDYLEAIEAMNVKFLPGRAYTIPYIKSYAQLVGLDPQALLAQFLRESALTREDVQPQLRNPESKPRRERPWLVALAAAMVAIGFIAWQAVRDRTTEIKSAAAPTTNARYNQPATPEAATPIVTEPVAPVGVAPVIELVATEQAWLEVRGAEGTIFLSRDLKPGDRYRPDVGVGWTLHAKDGGAFAVTIDGQPVGVLGEKGSPVLGRHVDTMAEAMKPKAPVVAPSQG